MSTQPRWKLIVEGLGKIERAEVEIRPLLLFVGENNSGKSYLASLLWGLFTDRSALFPETEEEYRASPWIACGEWLRRRFEERAEVPSVTLTKEDASLFVRAFNEALAQKRAEFVEGVFNSAAVSASRIEIVDFDLDGEVSLRWAKPSSRSAEVGYSVLGGSESLAMGQGLTAAFEWHKLADLLHDVAGVVLLGNLYNGPSRAHTSYQYGDPVFLPASRTGFMLLYKSVLAQEVGRSLRRTKGAVKGGLLLTAPAIHFLTLLALEMQPDHLGGEFPDEANFLEQPLGGRLEQSRGSGMIDYMFRHEKMGAPLPMALSSSLVTEIAPIVFVLRNIGQLSLLIIEEPEAHLHPSLQRRLARVIVHLIRKGLYVWLTTHSENFCQQINNFIKIGESAGRADLQAKLDYEEEDCLKLTDVAAYQFKMDKVSHRSLVTNTQRTEQGLVMPTFNEELHNLGKETLLLQRRAKGSE